MRFTILLLALASAFTLAATNAAVAPRPVASQKPQTAASLKPQATTLGTESITIPQMLSYQGKLTDTLGQPVPNSNYQLTFKLYTVATGGSAFWTEDQTVPVSGGLFSALLGSVVPITSLPDSGAVYLGLQVATAPELSPRLQLVGSAYSYLAGKSANSDLLQGKDTTGFVRTGQANSITGTMIVDGTISSADLGDTTVGTAKLKPASVTAPKLNQMGASSGQVLKWTGSAWAPRNDSVGASDNAWVRRASPNDSILWTVNNLGIARGGAGDTLIGTNRFTQVNLGMSSTTGAASQNYAYCTVGGGDGDTASGGAATVGGGSANTASGGAATVGGGYENAASGDRATVGGGDDDTANAERATVGGGYYNTANGFGATVGGGQKNTASGYGATVSGGDADTAAAEYSFAVGYHSVVPASYSYSAAFNGQTATASNQLCCGVLSKTGGSFTIDDPIDPQNKLLNHYFVESPDMSNLYSGSVVLDGNGRAEVRLPDYFDALNRNPRAQLTGVGSSDVYVAEDISGNRFVIGGKPGIKVYWQVTGDRKDQSAEVIRTMMPVEQPKTGAMVGVSKDDNFLVGCMQQLEQMGKAGEFSFRTAAGRQRYENMLKQLREAEQHKSAQPELQQVKAVPHPQPSTKLPQPSKGQKQPAPLTPPQGLQQ